MISELFFYVTTAVWLVKTCIKRLIFIDNKSINSCISLNITINLWINYMVNISHNFQLNFCYISPRLLHCGMRLFEEQVSCWTSFHGRNSLHYSTGKLRNYNGVKLNDT